MQAWADFIRLQESELGADIVKKWLKPLKVVNFDACNLYLTANDSFQINWFEEHVRKRANEVLLNNNHKKIKIHISFSGEDPSSKTKKKVKKGKEKPSSVTAPTFTISFDELDPICTFENFSLSSVHNFAYKLLCQTIGYDIDNHCIGPNKMELGNFNPIYLCGPSGVGKTHLLMATAQILREQGKAVTYVRAETFTEHFVTAIRAGEMNLFRQSYRNTDVLIIEDVHLFARKDATQEELFHTFNALHVDSKQIILSANCNPIELQFIEPRLISRFEWGIVLPIKPPSQDEMRKMLQTKAMALNCKIPPVVAEFLLDTFTSSFKSTVRALEALILRAHLHEESANSTVNHMTLTSAKRLLSDLVEEEQRSALNPEKVIQQVTEYFGIRPEDVLGKAQSRDCVLPRQMAMFICRTQLKMPFMRVGELFSKDHSTVMSSVKLIQRGIDNNDESISVPFLLIQKRLRS